MSDISKVSMILTKDGITLFLDGRQYSVARDTGNFQLVQKAFKAKDITKLRQALEIKKNIASHTEGRVTIVENELHYDGAPLRNALATRVVEILRDGFDVKPIMRFLDNLMNNPSASAREELYGFLEACNLPITPEGHFLAYKRVNNDYRDIYTSTIDNSVGTKPSMPREAVDDDRNRTCSSGLHVCSESYLPHFGTGGGNRVVVCKVNPADVVSVPKDYGNAKMRVCQYEVVSEIPQDEVGELLGRLPVNYTTNYSPDYSDDDLDDDAGFEADEFDDDGFDDNAVDDELSNPYTAVVVNRNTPPVLPGESNPSSKLTDHAVRSIRTDLANGHTVATVADWYDISPRQVGRIRDRTAWAHVK